MANETTLDTLVVSATENSFLEPHVQQFNREDFVGSYFNLSDFLKSASGIQIQDSGLGSPSQVSIRGSSHKQIKFIIDGHEVNDSLYGDFDLNSIPLNQIEEITLVQGNSATYNHSDAVGGTILITTLSPDRKDITIRTGLGNYGLKEAGLVLPWALYGNGNISLEYIEGKNDYEYEVPQPFGSTGISNQWESIRNNQYEKLSALVKWKSIPNNSWSSGLKFHQSSDTKRLPDFQRNRPVNRAYFKSNSLSLQSYFDFNVSDAITLKNNLSLVDNEDTYSDLDSIFGLGSNYVEYNSSILDISSVFSINKNNYSFDTKIGIKSERFKDVHPLISNSVKCDSPTATCDTLSRQTQASLTQQFSIYDNKQTHSVNLMFKVSENQKEKEELYGLYKSFEHDMQYTTWSSQYSYFGIDYFLPSIILAKSIRIPTLYELFGDRGLLKSNLSLEPETSHNLSLNTTLKFNTIQVNQSLFYRELEDAIVGQFSSGTGSYKNLNGAKITGWQGSISKRYSHSNIELNWTFQDSLTESEVNASDQKKVPSIFHKLANLRISYDITSRLNSTYIFHTADEMYLNTNNTAKHSGIETHSIKVKYSLKRTTFSGSLENILDSKYNDQFNRPAAGRLLSIKISYIF